jgi:hypothetical protein
LPEGGGCAGRQDGAAVGSGIPCRALQANGRAEVGGRRRESVIDGEPRIGRELSRSTHLSESGVRSRGGGRSDGRRLAIRAGRGVCEMGGAGGGYRREVGRSWAGA